MEIIVADDEPLTRLLLEESLLSWGYSVYAVENGEQVLALLKEKPDIQLLLIDWSMPGMNGIELCRQIKANSSLVKYVVMLTGKSGTDCLVQAMEAGADDFLTKPFIPEELKVRIRAGCRIIEQERQLQSYANIDAMTGIWNRRMILCHLESELARAKREQSNLAVCIMDLDHFKKINDTYGHQTGDDVLQYFTQIVKKQMRPYDYFGRYGGEEFLLIIPKQPQSDSLCVVERIKSAVSNATLQRDNLPPIQFTVSIGVTIANQYDTNIEEVIKRADMAAYKAKHSGRNTIVLM